MEFAENFVLSAGTTIAENIKERAKQDRADMLSVTKELKTNIAKNKAKDIKERNKLRQIATDIIGVLPAAATSDSFMRELISSKTYRDRIIEAIDKDTSRTGDWFTKEMRDQFGMGNITNIYDVPTDREDTRRPGAIVARLRGTALPKIDKKTDEERSNNAEATYRTLLGAGMGASGIIEGAKERLEARGTPRMDIDRFAGAAYIPPTIRSRNIPRQPRVLEEPSDAQQRAAIGGRKFLHDQYKSAPKQTRAALTAFFRGPEGSAIEEVIKLINRGMGMNEILKSDWSNRKFMAKTEAGNVEVTLRDIIRRGTLPEEIQVKGKIESINDLLNVYITGYNRERLKVTSYRGAVERGILNTELGG